MITKKGYDINIVNEGVTLYGYTFYFSKHSNYKKFLEYYSDNVMWMTTTFNNKYHYDVELAIFSLFVFYRMVERDIFAILTEDGLLLTHEDEIKFSVEIEIRPYDTDEVMDECLTDGQNQASSDYEMLSELITQL